MKVAFDHGGWPGIVTWCGWVVHQNGRLAAEYAGIKVIVVVLLAATHQPHNEESKNSEASESTSNTANNGGDVNRTRRRGRCC